MKSALVLFILIASVGTGQAQSKTENIKRKEVTEVKPLAADPLRNEIPYLQPIFINHVPVPDYTNNESVEALIFDKGPNSISFQVEEIKAMPRESDILISIGLISPGVFGKF